MMAEFSLETLFKLHTTDLPNLIKDCLSPKLPAAEHVTADIDHWEEIGEGNLNFVYRVWLKPHDLKYSTQECTVIVKYAPAYIKVLGPSYPLTQKRLEVEFAAMLQYHKLYSGCVPVPILFDKQQNTIIMEDLRGYEIMRNQLIKGVVDTAVVKELMVSIATTHRLTLQTSCGLDEYKRLCDVFSNKDMVSITEHYIFIKPYCHDDPTNKHHPLLNEKVEELRADKEACQQAEEMRRLFLESQQCLCHGDLHTGSVMVKDGQPKIFDIEFAFMGPAAFDFGMFIANLIFALIRHHVTHTSQPIVQALWEAISVSIESYNTVWSSTDDEMFVSRTCGFLGCELIRRVIGAAHVEDLFSVPEGELLALVLGRAFLLSSSRKGYGDLMSVVKKTLTEYGL